MKLAVLFLSYMLKPVLPFSFLLLLALSLTWIQKG
jgi:hypothetical protein